MMECDFANNPCTSTPPSPSSPPSPALLPFSAPVTPQRISGNECFSCRRKGHWAKECPNKTPQKSQPSSPGSIPRMVLVCHRFDVLVVEALAKFSPPKRRKILRGSSIGALVIDQRLILNLSRESTGPNGENWYFACRIKKNHGACSFFQWVDSEVNAMMRKGAENASNMPHCYPSEQDEMHNWELVMARCGVRDICPFDNDVNTSENKGSFVTSMEAAYDKLAEALELERQRDSVRGAAKVALETARVWLEQ
ncbi:hypothetical protein GH714_032634 [Hevea brasiliensis]|uniref:CCHC-type domain-containing protein n=1 Tax=Hevea brasiliensis TaxID=3981 RepID=A0A6A6NC78_HEVBR|nr:hypothetical protein GH714_032634 [Hevea brasiliensis]